MNELAIKQLDKIKHNIKERYELHSISETHFQALENGQIVQDRWLDGNIIQSMDKMFPDNLFSCVFFKNDRRVSFTFSGRYKGNDFEFYGHQPLNTPYNLYISFLEDGEEMPAEDLKILYESFKEFLLNRPVFRLYALTGDFKIDTYNI